MKKILFMAIAAVLVLMACSKERNEKGENLCPVIAESVVPQVVKDSFLIRYPATAVTTWFYKDSSSYCALFTLSAVEKLAQFSPDGTFLEEIIETHQEGQFEDSTSTTTNGVKGSMVTGCECEVHKEHD